MLGGNASSEIRVPVRGAKGIENQDQFEFFEELDCFKGQGFLIGKPMPLNELLDYINTYAVHSE